MKQCNKKHTHTRPPSFTLLSLRDTWVTSVHFWFCSFFLPLCFFATYVSFTWVVLFFSFLSHQVHLSFFCLFLSTNVSFVFTLFLWSCFNCVLQLLFTVCLWLVLYLLATCLSFFFPFSPLFCQVHLSFFSTDSLRKRFLRVCFFFFCLVSTVSVCLFNVVFFFFNFCFLFLLYNNSCYVSWY